MKKSNFFKLTLVTFFCLMQVFPFSADAQKKKDTANIKLLLIDGQSVNHKHWKEWTPVLLKELNDSKLFLTDVYTTPAQGESMKSFNPQFKDYDVIVSLYDGDVWPEKVQKRLQKYILKGGGLVVVHAADNAFPEWPAYNEMIGLGGWGNRTEKDGPYVYIDDNGKTIRDNSPGKAGHHGARHEFQIVNQKPDHPIMKNLPEKWLHTEDELYDHLRGPAKNMEILATAYSDEKYNGTKHNEPMLMTIAYGKGHVFHTAMGHDKLALSGVGFMTTFIRGCEWVAHGKVTFPVPPDFPTSEESGKRQY